MIGTTALVLAQSTPAQLLAPTLAMSSWVLGLSVAGFFLVCLLLVLTILIQKPQGGGLAGAFGSSAGSGQTAFGAKTGDALTIATIAIFVLYVVAAIGLNFALNATVKPDSAPKVTGKETPGEKTPEAPSTPFTSGTTAPQPIEIKPSDPKPVENPPVNITPAPAPSATPTTPAPSTTPATTPAPAATPAPASTLAPASAPATTPAPAGETPKP